MIVIRDIRLSCRVFSDGRQTRSICYDMSQNEIEDVICSHVNHRRPQTSIEVSAALSPPHVFSLEPMYENIFTGGYHERPAPERKANCPQLKEITPRLNSLFRGYQFNNVIRPQRADGFEPMAIRANESTSLTKKKYQTRSSTADRPPPHPSPFTPAHVSRQRSPLRVEVDSPSLFASPSSSPTLVQNVNNAARDVIRRRNTDLYLLSSTEDLYSRALKGTSSDDRSSDKSSKHQRSLGASTTASPQAEPKHSSSSLYHTPNCSLYSSKDEEKLESFPIFLPLKLQKIKHSCRDSTGYLSECDDPLIARLRIVETCQLSELYAHSISSGFNVVDDKNALDPRSPYDQTDSPNH